MDSTEGQIQLKDKKIHQNISNVISLMFPYSCDLRFHLHVLF